MAIKKNKNKMKKLWNLILHNHLFKIVLFALFTLIGSILIDFFEFDTLFSHIIQWIGIIGLAIYVVVLIIYAFIINPIRNRRKK